MPRAPSYNIYLRWALNCMEWKGISILTFQFFFFFWLGNIINYHHLSKRIQDWLANSIDFVH